MLLLILFLITSFKIMELRTHQVNIGAMISEVGFLLDGIIASGSTGFEFRFTILICQPNIISRVYPSIPRG